MNEMEYYRPPLSSGRIVLALSAGEELPVEGDGERVFQLGVGGEICIKVNSTFFQFHYSISAP